MRCQDWWWEPKDLSLVWVFLGWFLSAKMVTSLGASLLCGLVGLCWWLLVLWRFGVRRNRAGRVDNFLRRLRVGAHRGAALDSPENTLYAFAQAKAHGADFVELDLMFTAEGVPIVFHDLTLDRVTNGRGAVESTSFRRISTLNAANSWSGDLGVPTLHEAVSAILDLKLTVIIDVKRPHPLATQTIVELFAAFPALYSWGLVSSYHPMEILKIRRRDRRILCAHTWCWDLHRDACDEATGVCVGCGRLHSLLGSTYPAALVWDLWEVFLVHSTLLTTLSGVSVLLADRSAVSEEYRGWWARRGVHLIAYTVNDIHQRLFFLNSLHIPFLTDRLADIEPLLKDMQAHTPFEDRGPCARD